ncbi:MAG TPA: Na(+)/H(+) antiporter subunit F1 [Bacillus bacterium]|uniref:Na(+)/H(+) antiporter subunit F n=1 Tax=Siminovitchia fordii TaxID=254759 RepID=A0ABQ4K4B1_9BACI|nr:Na(+)/H(+) antiporter subunit F1 [Siminovitchia fordii]GIN19850.1 Na(+)/H(+) antiporter subunit F [Siminovitchia fordii]HBZ10934.1 Na(+)/H(+) antiporter subunit F1 [Bacillus sp. (in: firmicutes)]
MLDIVIKIALLGFAISSFILLLRVIKGPSTPDRVVALDAMGINLIAITALMSMLLATNAYLDVILLLGILSFIGTVAFSKFLEKGVIVEYERNR